VAIPRRGKPGVTRKKVELRRGFRKLVKWRTGSEGRISYLKRDWEWGRSRMDGERGARTWCGWGILASNSVKISGLIATKDEDTPTITSPQRPSRPAVTGPPPTCGSAA
jgi:IS5 family transposase